MVEVTSESDYVLAVTMKWNPMKEAQGSRYTEMFANSALACQVTVLSPKPDCYSQSAD